MVCCIWHVCAVVALWKQVGEGRRKGGRGLWKETASMVMKFFFYLQEALFHWTRGGGDDVLFHQRNNARASDVLLIGRIVMGVVYFLQPLWGAGAAGGYGVFPGYLLASHWRI